MGRCREKGCQNELQSPEDLYCWEHSAGITRDGDRATGGAMPLDGGDITAEDAFDDADDDEAEESSEE